MLIGYARVSKADGSQSLDLQRDALRADGVDAGHVYHDVASGAGARVMTDSPTRVAAQRRHHGVPGAAVAVMAAAATLLPGLAVAQDIYVRAGLDLSRPADTHFTDADCASLVPAALYGCGVGGDGAPLRSVGDVGTVAGVGLGLGYAVAPAVRLEALLTSRPRFTFDGHANFLAPDRVVAHYHHERNHQGLDNRLILPLSTAPPPRGRVPCRQRLGGMLHYYYRSAV